MADSCLCLRARLIDEQDSAVCSDPVLLKGDLGILHPEALILGDCEIEQHADAALRSDRKSITVSKACYIHEALLLFLLIFRDVDESIENNGSVCAVCNPKAGDREFEEQTVFLS